LIWKWPDLISSIFPNKHDPLLNRLNQNISRVHQTAFDLMELLTKRELSALYQLSSFLFSNRREPPISIDFLEKVLA